MEKLKGRAGAAALAAVMILVVMGVALMHWLRPVEFYLYSSEGISYEKAVVTEIQNENLELQPGETNRYLGTQNIVVRMKTGAFEGQEKKISNNLSTTHNILVRSGQRVVVKVDHPENTEAFLTVYNYDRTLGIALVVLFFAAFMVLVGGAKGAKSLLGLLFILFFIVAGMIPMIYNGLSPVLACLITVLISTTVSMLLLNGFGVKTMVAILATIIGVMAAAVIFALFAQMLHLSGFNLDEAEELILISESTGLNISQMLFVSIVIASLGAVMDMTMSIASALYEMKAVNPAMTPGEIISSGMNIGKDMIGTMSETLILAFAGTAVTTMIIVLSYGASFDQMLSSDYVAMEILQAVTGSVAVILSVPLTALLSGRIFTGGGKNAA